MFMSIKEELCMAVPGFSVGKKVFDRSHVMIIAEIGTGHGGELDKALELIHASVEAGADCVKFQHVYADEIIHPATGLVPLPGGPTPLYDTFKALETGPDFLARLKDSVESRGAIFLCTPFGLRSARELRALGVSAMKIASPELNYCQLIDEVASFGLPTILSSGVSRLSDIERAMDAFNNSAAEVALLHCVTAYPAPEEDYNLRILKTLGSIFGVAVGVSDHSADPLAIPAIATLAGACVIEKHICLSRSDHGLDDPIAITPPDFTRMVASVRSISSLLAQNGDAEAAMASVVELFGAQRVQAALGDGRKRLAPSEAANYSRTNRSIHARHPIARGTRLTEDAVAILRTEKILRPGLEPRLLPLVIGRVAARDIPDGEGVEWADLGGHA